jgi:hypothetical protein
VFPYLRPRQRQSLKALALLAVTGLAFLSIGFLPLRVPAFRLAGLSAPVYAAQDAPRTLLPISIDYPEDGSIFPPGITPPTFLWRDAAGTSWSIDVTFAGKAPAIHVLSKGERMRIGAIDPDCVADSNEPPKLTLQQAAAWTWTPDAATWDAIQANSVAQPATVVITGYRDGQIAFSQARIQLTTSPDPVGAPIFYRDVPLMPEAGVNGVVSAAGAHRDSPHSLAPARHSPAGEPHRSQRYAHLRQLPLLLRDGKTFGMDVDGPANDKGLYAIVPVRKHMTIESKDMVHWNTDGRVGLTGWDSCLRFRRTAATW